MATAGNSLSEYWTYTYDGLGNVATATDGKLLVVCGVNDDTVWLSRFSLSIQQREDGPAIELLRAVRGLLSEELHALANEVPGFQPDLPAHLDVNGGGGFETGGPQSDNGLSGKKLVVDAYGPRVPIGGGALSGKDLYKPDRAGAILARRLAKAVVLTGAARECTATLAILPGEQQFFIVSIRNERGETLDPRRWDQLVDLHLETVGSRYTNTTDLLSIARHGHFTQAEHPWEQVALA